MKLRLTGRALDDIRKIGNYLRGRNSGASIRVRDAIEAGLELIRIYPQAGRLRRHGVRRLTLPRYPYLIFYKVDTARNEIVVLTIRHGARRPFA